MLARYQLIITIGAMADLQAIHGYIAQQSIENAPKMVDRILEAIHSLESAPHRTLFQPRSRKIRYPVRSLPVGRYVVYFRVLENQKLIRILTVRHGARRRPRRFPAD